MSKSKSSLLKNLELTWWQAGIFKLSTISFGIILALNFYTFFESVITLIWITFLLPALYILYTYLKN